MSNTQSILLTISMIASKCKNERTRLTGIENQVLVALQNCNINSNIIEISYNSLARKTNRCKNTIIDAMKGLIGKGCVKKHIKWDEEKNQYFPNVYTICNGREIDIEMTPSLEEIAAFYRKKIKEYMNPAELVTTSKLLRNGTKKEVIIEAIKLTKKNTKKSYSSYLATIYKDIIELNVCTMDDWREYRANYNDSYKRDLLLHPRK